MSFPPMHQNKLQEEGFQDVVNISKVKFDSYVEIVGKDFSQFNEKLIKNIDSHSQTENEETLALEYPFESNKEGGEGRNKSKASALPNFLPQLLPDDEIKEGINSLNSKQEEAINMVHTWVKDYVKHNAHNVEPIYIFISGRICTAKFYLVKVTYNAISKTLLHYFKDPKSQGFFYLGLQEFQQ